MNNLFSTLKDRWLADSPPFFSKLKKIAITVGTSAASVWGVNTFLSLNLADPVLTICKYTIAVCAAVGLTSQITKDDHNHAGDDKS